MERAGLFVIHPYSNFRFSWDMATLVRVSAILLIFKRFKLDTMFKVMLLLNVILIPMFMAFPVWEFQTDKPIEEQPYARTAMIIR